MYSSLVCSNQCLYKVNFSRIVEEGLHVCFNKIVASYAIDLFEATIDRKSYKLAVENGFPSVQNI